MPSSSAQKLAVPFRISILALFSLVSIGLVSGILWFHHWHSRGVVTQSAVLFMREVSSKVLERTENTLDQLKVLADNAVLLPTIADQPSLYGHSATAYLLNALSAANWAQSVFLGFNNGAFFGILKLDGRHSAIRQRLGAPVGSAYAVWIVQQLPDGRFASSWRFLDDRYRTLGSRFEAAATFDPRNRPWFQKAMLTLPVIVTDTYQFAASGEFGVTVARRFDGRVPGALGVNFSLASMADFLHDALDNDSRGKIASMALIAGDQTVLASAGADAHPTAERAVTVADLPPSPLKMAAQITTDRKERIFDFGDETYVATTVALPGFMSLDVHAVYVAPVNAFVGPLNDALQRTILFSALLVLLGCPIIFYASGRIAKPVVLLTHKARRIRLFDLAPSKPIHSRISEVRDLAEAMAAMRESFAAFTKYMPVDLVRSIVQMNMKPEPGGSRQPVTVMFTDIQDFTPLCETLAPERVVETVCQYLQGMVTVVQDGGGTVDKFVGDAIMAYWNAPAPNVHHVRDACMTALKCQRWTNTDNRIRAANGEPELYTRFAVHTGDAIVGNVGSGNRLDYTVIGATVNTASRLEALNKYYGTQIIVSEQVVREAGPQFQVRYLDRVLPKGTQHPLTIYELIGIKPDAVRAPADLIVPDELLVRCTAWETVIAAWQDRDWPALAERSDAYRRLFGSDRLLEIYARRAQRFLSEPPQPDWNGVEIFLTKR